MNAVEQLRAVATRNNAVAHYRRAAQVHETAASQMMLDGWFSWAGEALRFADYLERAAAAEERDPQPAGLR